MIEAPVTLRHILGKVRTGTHSEEDLDVLRIWISHHEKLHDVAKRLAAEIESNTSQEWGDQRANRISRVCCKADTFTEFVESL